MIIKLDKGGLFHKAWRPEIGFHNMPARTVSCLLYLPIWFPLLLTAVVGVLRKIGINFHILEAIAGLLVPPLFLGGFTIPVLLLARGKNVNEIRLISLFLPLIFAPVCYAGLYVAGRYCQYILNDALPDANVDCALLARIALLSIPIGYIYVIIFKFGLQ